MPVIPFLVASLQPVGAAFARCPAPSRAVHILARAAFEEDWGSAAGGAAYDVVVRDIRTGRIAVGASVSERGGDVDDQAEVILLKRNGSVAWLARTGPPDDIDNHLTREVHIADRAGIRLLDQDSAIAENSLKMSRDRRSISWRHPQTVRSASSR